MNLTVILTRNEHCKSYQKFDNYEFKDNFQYLTIC